MAEAHFVIICYADYDDESERQLQAEHDMQCTAWQWKAGIAILCRGY